jgi:amino acid transporter
LSIHEGVSNNLSLTLQRAQLRRTCDGQRYHLNRQADCLAIPDLPFFEVTNMPKATSRNQNATEPANDSQGHLSLFDCVCIIVGTIVGAGIFVTPTIVAGNMPSQMWLLTAWGLGGLVAVLGALCFAELVTTYPDRGGDYGYLKRAFGRPVGFAFSWTAFWVIRPGNIGAMAFAFGSFAAGVFGESMSSFNWATLAVVFISLLNAVGVQAGKVTQNVLTVIKVSAIVLLLLAAILFRPSQPEVSREGPIAMLAQTSVNVNLEDASTVAAELADAGGEVDAGDAGEPSNENSAEWFWLSMVFVMFAFGGWNDIAFVASEARDPKRNLLRALIFGTAAVVAIYLLVNVALLYGLGFDRLKLLAEGDNLNGPLVLAKESFGDVGGIVLSLAVCVSCLGSISAMIFTSPRIYWATAEDDSRLAWLIGDRRRSWIAIVVQAVVTLAMMWAFSRTTKGFDAIVTACAPYFWTFLSLTVVTVFVNRVKFRGQFSGFRTPLYPLPPVLFIAACWFMTVRSVQYMLFQQLHWQAFAIGMWVLAGLLIGVALVCTNPSKGESS